MTNQKEVCTEVRNEIKELFKEQGVTIKVTEIDKRLNKLLGEFKVPRDEAKRSMIKVLNREHDIDVKAGSGSMVTEKSTVHDLTNGKWANLHVVVKQLWETNHESINQTGLFADETGAIKFTSWASADIPTMEEGKSYLVKNIITKEWNGNLTVDLNKTSSIELLDETIEAGQTEETITGFIVAIKNGSGLISRCPECNRALLKGACKDHGKISEPIKDIRVMGYIDVGVKAIPFIMNSAVTEVVMGMSLKDCLAAATEALDQEIVIETFRKKLMGKYYSLTGPNFNQLIVNTAEKIDTVNADVTAELVASILEA